jgi:hypothetical protein
VLLPSDRGQVLAGEAAVVAKETGGAAAIEDGVDGVERPALVKNYLV